jgi:3-dehydroquinate dehydratase II
MKRVLVLNGPNLNLLGTREPAVYGSATLAQINAKLAKMAEDAGVKLDTYQSNIEGELINRIHAAVGEGVGFIIINPAGYTHTSIAIRDALSAVQIPAIEVHISNIHTREPFRSHSYISGAVLGVIAGFGPQSYELALHYALTQLASQGTKSS